jgi:hypothetical protein
MIPAIGFAYQLWALTSHKLFGWKWGIVSFRSDVGSVDMRLCRLATRGQGRNAKVYANIPTSIRGGEWRQVPERDVMLMYPRLPKK